MIRAAAKNHAFAAVVVSPRAYDAVLEELRETDGMLSLPTRESLAAEAFAYTARYDTAIARWFAEKGEDFPPLLRPRLREGRRPALRREPAPARRLLRPGRRARRTCCRRSASTTASRSPTTTSSTSTRRATLVRDFEVPGVRDRQAQQPVRRGRSATNAPRPTSAAFACDPMSAFGGVIALNRPVDRATAEALDRAVHRGPDRAGLRRRRARDAGPEAERPHPRGPGAPRCRCSASPRSARSPAACSSRTATSQREDRDGDGGRHRARARPSRSGPTCCSPGACAATCSSNAIVLAQRPGDGRDRRRPDEPRRLGPPRGREGARPTRSQGAALASDAFFPFADGPELAIEAGVTAIIQPGGSMRDDEVIAAADEARRRDGLHRPPPLPPLMGAVERHGSGGPCEQAVGYSRVIRAGDLVVVAGTTALDARRRGRRPRRPVRADAPGARRTSRRRSSAVGAGLSRRHPHARCTSPTRRAGGARPRPRGGVRRHPPGQRRWSTSLRSLDPRMLVEIEADAYARRAAAGDVVPGRSGRSRDPSGACRSMPPPCPPPAVTRPPPCGRGSSGRLWQWAHGRRARSSSPPPRARARRARRSSSPRTLLRERAVGRVAVICPTTPLTRQWAAAAARMGLQLVPDAADLRPPRDFQGVAVTYARVATVGRAVGAPVLARDARHRRRGAPPR